MLVLRRIIGGLRRLFHKNQVERELDEELREYLEMSAERHMSAGMTRDEAVRAAHLRVVRRRRAWIAGVLPSHAARV